MVDQVARKLAKPPINHSEEEAQPGIDGGEVKDPAALAATLSTPSAASPAARAMGACHSCDPSQPASSVDITVVIGRSTLEARHYGAPGGKANAQVQAAAAVISDGHALQESEPADMGVGAPQSSDVAAKETSTLGVAYKVAPQEIDYVWIDWVALVQVPQGMANAQPNLALVKATVMGCPKGQSSVLKPLK